MSIWLDGPLVQGLPWGWRAPGEPSAGPVGVDVESPIPASTAGRDAIGASSDQDGRTGRLSPLLVGWPYPASAACSRDTEAATALGTRSETGLLGFW